MAIEMGIASKSGSWFTYGDVRIGQGRENAKQFLEENLAIASEMEGRIRGAAFAATEKRPTTFRIEDEDSDTLALAI